MLGVAYLQGLGITKNKHIYFYNTLYIPIYIYVEINYNETKNYGTIAYIAISNRFSTIKK